MWSDDLLYGIFVVWVLFYEFCLLVLSPLAVVEICLIRIFGLYGIRNSISILFSISIEDRTCLLDYKDVNPVFCVPLKNLKSRSKILSFSFLLSLYYSLSHKYILFINFHSRPKGSSLHKIGLFCDKLLLTMELMFRNYVPVSHRSVKKRKTDDDGTPMIVAVGSLVVWWYYK